MYRVLLVDDEPFMIESLKKVIDESNAFEVMDIAYMVNDAKIIVEKNVPDVIITDIKMPGGTGIELIEHISQQNPEVVLIVVSSYDNFEYVRNAFLLGAEDYLLKPISPKAFNVFLEKLEIKLNNKQSDSASKKQVDKAKEMYKGIPESKKQIELIEEFINENLAEDNSVDIICKNFFITQTQLNRIFRKYKDCTYNEFLTSLRIAKAKKLLVERQDLLIGTIAKLCGFSDQFYFSKVFKNYTGVSPSELRKN